jgi:ferredoxin
MRRYLTPILIACLLPIAAWGVQRFPPPEFSTEHALPELVMPGFRPEWLPFLDVALLAAALALAAWFVYKQRSRTGVFAVTLFSILYFGFFRRGCVCSVGSLQNVTYALTHGDYALPLAVAAFFLLPLAFALFAGRVFCAAVCPLGAAQDVVLFKPIKLPAWLQHTLGLLPYLYLGAGVLFAALGTHFLVCEYDPFVALYRLSGPVHILLFAGALLALGMFVGRPYCRFLCPYGVLLRWTSLLARWRVRITPKTCVNCRLCEDACPYGALHPPTPASGERREGRGRLTLALLALPVLLALGAWGGYKAIGPLYYNDPMAAQARVLEQQEADTGAVAGERPVDPVFVQAYKQKRAYELGGALFGLWVGLVLGGKLIALSVRRRRTEYETDAGGCLACTRCYASCPVEHDRLTRPAEEVEAS